MKGAWFITGTGTDVGKTVVGCAVATILTARGHSVRAIKPIETGCDPRPVDAEALAAACQHPELAHWPGLMRMRAPLAPYAATLEGEPPVLLDEILTATRAAMAGADYVLVEGAGGVLVPLDETRYILNLSQSLGFPVVLVARDGLGVLSQTLTAARCLPPDLVVLSQFGDSGPSRRTNRAILRQRLRCPVITFGDDANALTDALLERG